MAKRCLFLLLFFLPLLVTAQQATIKGQVLHAQTRESLAGVNIRLSTTEGVSSDAQGNFVLQVPAGNVKLTFTFIGFSPVTRTYEIKAGDVLTDQVLMAEESLLIEGVVISAGKYEQKLSEVPVSMAVLKPDMVERQNANEVTEALQKVPGLDISDGQPSIRGGSGYSYGAGSRVLVLVDDLPILTPDAGDPKWNFIPVENISQIEVLKGASSVLFGSSALNGVINVRTAFPGTRPDTRFTVNNGIYMNPSRSELRWWGSARPSFAGLNVLHCRMIGALDLVVGANVFLNNSFRESEGESHARLNAQLRYRDRRIKGLSYGLNGNYMYQDKCDFFLWQDADSGAWRQNPAAISRTTGSRLNLDPYVEYYGRKGGKHSLRTRYFMATNAFPGDSSKDNNSWMLYAEYQYHQRLKPWFDLTTGLCGTYGNSEAPLFGAHYNVNSAAYVQLDFRIRKKLLLSLGGRAEYARIDSSETQSSYALIFTHDTLNLPIWPVFRAGLQYPLFRYTFLRASFGQGYRFPTIAEKYIRTSLGSLNIFPNPDLKPETGWNGEIGVKQGLKLGQWNGYVDVAGFWTEYSNMMEFTFGLYPQDSVPSLDDLGFKSINVGRARITGVDITLAGQGRLWKIPVTLLLGYTYTDPRDLVKDPVYLNGKSTAGNILKYRNYYSIKGDVEFEPGLFLVGLSYSYSSRIINIDRTFEDPLIPGTNLYILPGLSEYRANHNKGYHLLDLRIGFTPTEGSRFTLLLKNVLNAEYMTRPGLIEAPRSLALQYSTRF